MKIPLAFGTSGIVADVPDTNLLRILEMEGPPPITDPFGAVRDGLAEPIGGLPLADLAHGKRSACVVVSDITRPVPNAILLPPIFEVLEQSGISRENITVLIATGLHRPSTHGERVTIAGEEIARTCRMVDHHARARNEQHFLGTTARGTPVFIDRLYCDADLKITTGFIEPHLMAGFSGGRKLVAPGCAGEETIKALHSPAFIEDPRCKEGSIDDNPLHHELLEIARLAGHDFIVNVGLDRTHRITGVFAGDPLEAHAAGISFVRSAVRATLPSPADIVITTSAGFPLDLTLYQAVKGMTAALPVVRRGGTLILAAECAEGLGSPEFTALATSTPGAEEFMRTILSNPVVIDQWQLEECVKAVRHAEVVLVSPRIAAEFSEKLFITSVPTMDEALSRALARHGPAARIAVIPKGPYTLVELAA